MVGLPTSAPYRVFAPGKAYMQRVAHCICQRLVGHAISMSHHYSREHFDGY